MSSIDNYSDLDFENELETNIPNANILGTQYSDAFAFRSMAQKWANQKDAISGEGSLFETGRYNVGRKFNKRDLSDTAFQNYRFKVLYLSCDLSACIAEIEHYASKDNKNPNKKENIANSLAKTIVGVRLQLTKCLDLTDHKVLRSIQLVDEKGNVDISLLTKDWFTFNFEGKIAPTQLIGRVAKDKGYEALIVPSARSSNCDGSVNIIDEKTVLSKASLVNEGVLPKEKLEIYD